MHSSITPAPQGNTASPLLGGDTTFQRGESPAGAASSLEVCPAPGRLTVVASWAVGGKEICFVENMFFFFQSSLQAFGLFSKAAESHCGFGCLALHQMLVVWDWREVGKPRGAVIESKWAVCLYNKLRFSFFQCVPLFRNAMGVKSAMVYIKSST